MESSNFLSRIIKNRIIRLVVLGCLIIGGYEISRYIVISVYKKMVETFFPGEDVFTPITVEAEDVRRGSIIRNITVPGRLLANQKVVLKPEVEGKIKKVYFEGGQAVQKGDPLYEINDRVFKAKLKEAKAKLALAKQEFARASKLAANSAGSLKQKEKAQSDLLEAEAALDIEQHRVDNAIIKAPFDGYIGLNDHSEGAFIDQRTELATVIDSDPMKIDFKVPAKYMKQISVGQTVILTVDGFGKKEFKAEIVNIDAKIDGNVHSASVRASISNPRNFLKAGIFTRIKVIVGSKDDALLVPRGAVKSSGEEEYVFRVITGKLKNGKIVSQAFKIPVVTGLASGEIIEITRGLREGEKIVVIGLDKIRDKFPVEILNPDGTPASTKPDVVASNDEDVDVEDIVDEEEYYEDEEDESLEESEKEDDENLKNETKKESNNKSSDNSESELTLSPKNDN